MAASGCNTLSAQSITFEENTTLTLTLGEINKDNALISLSTGNVSFSLGTIDFMGIDSLSEGEYLVLTLAEAELSTMEWNTDELTVKGLTAGDSIAWNESGTALYLNHKIIPEPTTATLSLLALAGLALRRRRK